MRDATAGELDTILSAIRGIGAAPGTADHEISAIKADVKALFGAVREVRSVQAESQ